MPTLDKLGVVRPQTPVPRAATYCAALLSIVTGLGLALRSAWPAPDAPKGASFDADFFVLTDLLGLIAPLAQDFERLHPERIRVHCERILRQIALHRTAAPVPGSSSASFQRYLAFVDLNRLEALLHGLLMDVVELQQGQLRH